MIKPFNLLSATLIVFCSLLLTSSCEEPVTDQAVVIVEETGITDEAFKSLWANVDKLWEERDPALVHTVYADAFQRTSPAQVSTTAEELTNEMNAIGGAYPDLKLNLISYELGGNFAIANWTVDGTFTGELGGIKGNGKPFEGIRGITVYTIEDGKVVKDESYWDTYAIFAVTGGYSIVPDK